MTSNQYLAVGAVVAAVATMLVLDSKAVPPRVLPPSKWDSHMIDLDKQALDEAYRDQLQRLFSVWMKDEAGQPDRAINGAQQARRAYIEVMGEIERRQGAKP